MQKFLLSALFLLFIFSSCKKADDKPESIPENRSKFEFTSLTAADTVMKIGMFTTITANAPGDGLSYTWTPEFGTLLGSGSSVEWSVCHADEFTITCEVEDQYGDKLSRSVDIHVNP